MKLAEAPERTPSTTWQLTGAPSFGYEAIVGRQLSGTGVIGHVRGGEMPLWRSFQHEIPLPISPSGLQLDAKLIETILSAAWRPATHVEIPDDLGEVTFESMPTSSRRLRGRIVQRPA